MMNNINTNTTGSQCVIPEHSKKKYNSVYQRFLNWCLNNKINSYSQDVLVNYFEEHSQQSKASTLWPLYSMLRTTLYINQNVDISQYIKLRAYLKRKALGYLPKKASTFTFQEIERFFKEAPDNKYLLAKVVLMIGMRGACLAEELRKLKLGHIKDIGSAVLIRIPSVKKGKDREIILTGCFYDLFKKYANLRPLGISDSSFFINYQNGKCTSQNVGIHKLGSMCRTIASYLNLPNPELYTAHCFRRSAHLLDSEITTSTIKPLENIPNGPLPPELEQSIDHIKDIKEEPPHDTMDSDISEPYNTSTFINSNEVTIKQEIDNSICDISKTERNDCLEDDEYFSIFAKYMASRLKRLKNRRLQSICQQRINQVFFELEMGNELEND